MEESKAQRFVEGMERHRKQALQVPQDEWIVGLVMVRRAQHFSLAVQASLDVSAPEYGKMVAMTGSWPLGTPADEYTLPLHPDEVGRGAVMEKAKVMMGKVSTCFSAGQG